VTQCGAAEQVRTAVVCEISAGTLPQEAKMKALKHSVAIAGLAAALSLTNVTTSSAGHWGGHWGGAAIGAGVAGFALGAAAAAAASPYYGYGGYGGYGGYYDYDPGAVVIVPAPGYYYGAAPYDGGQDYYYGWRRPGECRFSIRAC
jgi:hypothetical protein